MSANTFCWINMTDLRFFIYLGANEFEKKIGQNIKIDLSLKIPYENTEDKLESTINYGLVYEYLEKKILELNGTELLEYLAEQILNSLGHKFKGIFAAKIAIEKGYVPLKNFTGKVQIVAEKAY